MSVEVTGGTSAGSPTSTVPRTTTTPPPPLTAVTRPYAVGGVTTSFTDSTRPAGSAPVRTLRTTIWYPATGAPTQRGGQLPAADGRFPLIVFAHGWAVSAADYAPLLMEVAAAGYIVAAPDFPLTSRVNGAVDERDTFNQPADLSFLADQMRGTMNRDGLLAGHVWTGRFGAMGQSDGSLTVMGMGLNSCCLDPDLAGLVSLSGKVTGWVNGWFPTGSRPVLEVHGSNDTINPLGNGQQLFAQAPAGSAIVTIDGGDHFDIFSTRDTVPTIAAAAIAFFDQTVRGDATARTRLASAVAVPGFSLQLR